MKKKLIITIDGPAGSGKTTVSQCIANFYQYTRVDTGALYRGIGVMTKIKGVDYRYDDQLDKLCQSLDLHFVREGDQLLLYNHDLNLTDAIRLPDISLLASDLSVNPLVRNYLFDLQRQLGKDGGVVVEGRDMGTVVFPEADVKFFLTAEPSVRARRRHREYIALGIYMSENLMTKEMEIRDEKDRNRKIAPLIPAPDAIHVDSSMMDLKQVVTYMCQEIDKKLEG